MDVPPGLGCPAKIFSGGLGIPPAPFPDFSRRPGNRGQTRDLYIQVSKIELPAQMHGTGNMLESNWHNHPQGPSSWGGGSLNPKNPSHPTPLALPETGAEDGPQVYPPSREQPTATGFQSRLFSHLKL